MINGQLSFFPDQTSRLTRDSALADAIAPFQEYLRQEDKTDNTLKAFTSDLRLLAQYAGEDAKLGSFTTTRLLQFLEWLQGGRGVPCSAKSYARRVTTLKVFFKWLRESKITATDPALQVPQYSVSAPLATILRDDEVDRLLDETARRRFSDKASDARPELLVRLLLDTGIKKSECMNIRPDDVRRTGPAAPLLFVRRRTARDVYKERKVPLNPDWLEVLNEYLEQYEPPDRIFNCTPRNLEYVLADLAEAAGIPSVSFEMLRWTCAVRDHRAGTPPDKLREKLGLSRTSWRETGAKIERLAVMQQQEA
jgi:site-specific recombinase XerD